MSNNPDMIGDVLKFHVACDVPILAKPGFPSEDRIKLRLDLIEEEGQEVWEAVQDRDIAKLADGFADLIYVIVGAAFEFGIPLGDIWNIVQRANMAKVDTETGKVTRRADGKILKPEGWAPPDADIAVALGLSDPDAKAG